MEAPTAGSVILAGVLLKMGTYGLLRFCLPLFPTAAVAAAPYLCVLALIGIVYGALVAMVQPDLKKLVAYSSVSHMGLVVLGIFAFTTQGLQGVDAADAQPRAFDRCALPSGGHDLRSPPHAPDRRFRRSGAQQPCAGGGVPGRDAFLDRTAGIERLRRRSADPGGDFRQAASLTRPWPRPG